ncbi:Nif3-like dinuclear metal center hexameric protein [Candidatus Hydrogenedentota bacterium]
MSTTDITNFLDKEFRIEETADPNMTKNALTDAGRSFVLAGFHEKKTGLMFDFADSVDITYCATFITDEVLVRIFELAKGPSLLFTHHPFDYHEDERGLGPLSDEMVQELKERHIAVYAIHAPLDVGLNICASRSFAQRLSLREMKPFFPALGGHLGVYGRVTGTKLDEIANVVGHATNLDTVDVFDNVGQFGLTAVVAGGGDQVPILKEAESLGCTTYITGTAVHRWGREPIQKGNREFHEGARMAGMNLIGATHYNTEKYAVQDVAALLQQQGFPAMFVEDPVLREYNEGNYRVK